MEILLWVIQSYKEQTALESHNTCPFQKRNFLREICSDKERPFIALGTPQHWLPRPGQAELWFQGPMERLLPLPQDFHLQSGNNAWSPTLQYKPWRGTQSVFAANERTPCLIVHTELCKADLRFWLKVGRLTVLSTVYLKKVEEGDQLRLWKRDRTVNRK